ncbi:MAG: hypothetical protein ABIL76_03740 [candidate division WOR-3 bacterium]
MEKVKNRDSSIQISFGLVRSAVSRLTFLAKAYAEISQIELVNEKTMDNICPPQKGYDPECARSAIRKVRERIVNFNENIGNYEESVSIVNSLWGEVSECNKWTFPALACYSKNENKIYICPERIYKHKEPQIIFQKVLIHELVHAYLKTDKLNEHERIIEESLANAIAFIHFDKEKAIVSEFIKNQPLEYQGCYYWLKYNKDFLPFVLEDWKDRKFNRIHWWFYPYDIDEIIYILRRYYPFYPFYWFSFFVLSFEIPYRLARALVEYYYKTKDQRPLLKLLAMEILGND